MKSGTIHTYTRPTKKAGLALKKHLEGNPFVEELKFETLTNSSN